MTEIQAYEPIFMPVGVLTAALQELTPREQRDADPDLAVEEWLDFAKELGADCIELSAALHPSMADVPPEAMLDPVANTLDLRDPFDEQRAKRVQAAVDATGVTLADIGYFDDMLHEDPALRRKKHDFMVRVMDAAVLLGVSAVTGFIGRNQSRSMDQNLIDFEESFVPLLKAAKDRGLSYRVEQCPMPGWTPGDNFHNNIGYTPALWIALHKICERNGVADQFRIHYDPSHSILMGQDTRSMFQYLADEDYAFLIAGMHVKGQVIDARGVSAWGYGGQTVQRGDWDGDHVSANPADLANAWKQQTVLAEHELPGTARHDPLAYLQNRTVDWLDHQLAARELLDVDIAAMPLIVEHEYPAARVQDKDLLLPILAGSIDFTRHIDRAAAAMYALQHQVLAAQSIPVQGRGRQAFRS
ncbi:MAG: sugar phosphate isomerase/epimerase [Nocardioidaceae bacterium]|nr:sugar phosphate isomerase/epimerase [Nocardioidaceae bacterium]